MLKFFIKAIEKPNVKRWYVARKLILIQKLDKISESMNYHIRSREEVLEPQTLNFL